jgi:hypothetical protein
MTEPIKLTPEVQEEILKYVESGGAFATACRAAGLHPSTGSQWIKRGTPAALAFNTRLERAKARAETRMVLAIQKAASGHSTLIKKTSHKEVVAYEETRHPDGRVVKKPVKLVLQTTDETEGAEFDWRAAQVWLEARNPAEWKPKQEMVGDFTVTEKPFVATVDKIYGSDKSEAERIEEEDQAYFENDHAEADAE